MNSSLSLKGRCKVNNEVAFNVTFRDFDSSDAVRDAIQSRVERLETMKARVMTCDVVVSLPHKHPHKAANFHVEIKAHIPGDTIVINREPEKDDSHTDIYIAINDAFDALERKLDSKLERQRGHVKTHARKTLAVS